jgi:hypothetical protein
LSLAVAIGHHGLARALYVAAFVLQVAGAALLFVDIRDDRREAERIVRDALPVKWDTVDAVGEAFASYLGGRKRRRLIGVALIIIGAAVGLAANLAALS